MSLASVPSIRSNHVVNTHAAKLTHRSISLSKLIVEMIESRYLGFEVFPGSNALNKLFHF